MQSGHENLERLGTIAIRRNIEKGHVDVVQRIWVADFANRFDNDGAKEQAPLSPTYPLTFQPALALIGCLSG